ncbi:MAG: sigma-54-dependent Fis family transcriptional regulator [Deltaproteobacteria bacterium]|nr:sigma-54-dependent Fis family transcriptional regulator [Deltaproteobacteria bacterium]MBW2601598.1 sigma-54-dependent Fis family transcriptional regulator [Deltaproteobacteria bacterium]
MENILVIEESNGWRNLLSTALSSLYKVTYWPNGVDITTRLKQDNIDAIILDLQFQQEEPFALLKRLKSEVPNTPIVVTSEVEKAELVVRAVKEGAFEFITKPYSEERIKLVLEKALETRSLRNEIDYLRRKQDVIYSFDRIIAESQAMKKVIATLRKFSETDGTILVTGETGTGKSFLSGAIHFNSTRQKKPFIKINCTNIPEALLESELFGHERGAFTGANKTRIGRFEQASGGSAFLDEIGEMSPDLQAKLLRVLDEKSFERLGGNRTIDCDLRIITATNRRLEEQVAAGKFREDFYYRINVLTVHLPSLRERKACIEPLANYLLEKSCRSLRKNIHGLSAEVIDRFRDYSWPGNIRQLANTIERAVILEETDIIREENVSLVQPIAPPLSEERSSPTQQLPPSTMQPLHEHEKELILKSLEKNLWIQKDAAKQLEISPRALNYKIKKLGITHHRWRKNS